MAMMFAFAAAFLLPALVASSLEYVKGRNWQGYLPPHPELLGAADMGAVPALPADPVPDEWLWNNVNGVNYLTVSRNQHIPVYCGSCWAVAATSALSDRIKILRKGRWPDINIAPQVVVSCDKDVNGCHGGDSVSAYAYIKARGVTDETCSVYQAADVSCNKKVICETCTPGPGGPGTPGSCSIPDKFYKYTVSSIGQFTSANNPEEAMKREIYHRGPITCSIPVPDALLNYTGGVFEDTTGAEIPDHVISVTGYGVDRATGKKYWQIRNSWGTYWGEEGFFRVIRGQNNLVLENGQYCDFAIPENVWDGQEAELQQHIQRKSEPQTPREPFMSQLFKIIADFVAYAEGRKAVRRHKPCATLPRFVNGEHVRSPRPHEYLDTAQLPDVWDWRNVSGRNYLSWTVNQHIPVYCGSCWAQGTSSALADRFIIADYKRYANLALAVQTVLNCRAGGSCEGGNPAAVYEFAKDIGIPHVTCQNYLSRDLPKVEDCSKPNRLVCEDCSPWGEGRCWAKQDFKRYYASEYGLVNGTEAIMKEIYARGPIGCGLEVTSKFLAYSGGVYSEKLHRPPRINHEVSLVGWGRDDATGKRFWVGRNSWGTYWGEMGFFKIEMGDGNNNGIENACVWAVPKV